MHATYTTVVNTIFFVVCNERDYVATYVDLCITYGNVLATLISGPIETTSLHP